jgi:cytochrome c oxidase subunit 2
VIGHPRRRLTSPSEQPGRGRSPRAILVRRGRRPALAAAGFALLCLLLAACSGGPQDGLAPSGIYARRADNLFGKVFIIVVVVFVLVEGAIVFFLIKYREHPGRTDPVQIHGHTRAEAIWTIIPAVILAGVAIPTVKLIFDFAKAPPPANRIDVCVSGHQWWWQYVYATTCPPPGTSGPAGTVNTANELHIPVGKPVYLTLNSIDVIHAFWPPKLNGKQDVVPGHTNHMTIEADTPGTYYGQCSQFCGMSHANMRLRVIAETQSDYDAWVTAQEQPAATPAPGTLAAQGAQLFVQGRNNSGKFPGGGACATCHTIGGVSSAVGITGPNLTHVYSRQAFAGDTLDMNPDNLRLWLTNPPKEKPGSIMPNLGLSNDEITALVAYLQTLR